MKGLLLAGLFLLSSGYVIAQENSNSKKVDSCEDCKGEDCVNDQGEQPKKEDQKNDENN